MSPSPILVVDDNEALLNELTEALRGEGYLAQPAITGDIALVMLQQKIPFQLLVTDVVFPGVLDGFTLARRAKMFFPNIPIIYTTGHPDVAHIRARGAPYGEILPKPYRMAAMLKAISAALRSNGAIRTGKIAASQAEAIT